MSEMTEVVMEQITTTSQPRNLLKQFYNLQAERVQTYLLFDEGFQAYLKGAPNFNFQIYRQLVHEITETFQKISQDVISVKNSLSNEYNRNQLADIIDHVQEEEKKKLQFTAKLQIVQQNCIEHRDSPEELVQYQDEMVDLEKSLQETVGTIIEYMEELKYEAEDLYTEDGD